MNANTPDASEIVFDGEFLSKAGLVTLLLGIALCALGVFLDHPAAGFIALASCLAVSSLMALFSPNNLLSTITLAVAIPTMVVGGLTCLLGFML